MELQFVDQNVLIGGMAQELVYRIGGNGILQVAIVLSKIALAKGFGIGLVRGEVVMLGQVLFCKVGDDQVGPVPFVLVQSRLDLLSDIGKGVNHGAAHELVLNEAGHVFVFGVCRKVWLFLSECLGQERCGGFGRSRESLGGSPVGPRGDVGND